MNNSLLFSSTARALNNQHSSSSSSSLLLGNSGVGGGAESGLVRGDLGGGGGVGLTVEDGIFMKIFIAVLCSVVILLALIGNTLVVSVIIRYKQLQNATNYILLSLAIADITVTFLVMIPATIQDVTRKWIFSQLFCKFYNAFDITCCTASILHLLLVAIDRYIAIFKPLKYRDFVRNRYILFV